MAHWKTSSFFISLLLVVSALGLNAQKQSWQGLSLGADLSRLVVPFVDTTRYGWEVSGDYELLRDMFVAAEVGSQATRFSKADYSYQSSGLYTRLGVDYNFMKHLDNTSEDKLFIGARYCFTSFYHQASNIRVSDAVWGDFTGGSIDRRWMASNWLEVGLGMRARIVNNFYLGWSARMRIMLWPGNDKEMEPYHIPGYGRAYKTNTPGINYSLLYMIPIKKKKSLPDGEKKP